MRRRRQRRFRRLHAQCRLAAPCNAQARAGGDRFALDPDSGHCYVLYEASATTFEDANAACLAQGGYLASLTDAAEQQRVVPLLAGGARPWIGASDDPVQQTFAWLSGEPVGYQNFAAGKPGGDGDCVFLGDAAGGWHDAACASSDSADARLCEFQPH